MLDLIVAVASAFGVVFVAELGDKSQLLALTYGTRHSLRVVALGLTFGYATAGAVAAVVGGLLGAALPARTIGIAAGTLFLLFAWLAWREVGHDDGASDTGQAEGPTSAVRRNVVASIALTIAVAEFGDKTQIATAALAARSNPVATWLGATGGAVTAGMLGAVAGRHIGRRVDRRSIQLGSVVMFAAFGVILIATAW